MIDSRIVVFLIWREKNPKLLLHRFQCQGAANIWFDIFVVFITYNHMCSFVYKLSSLSLHYSLYPRRYDEKGKQNHI